MLISTVHEPYYHHTLSLNSDTEADDVFDDDVEKVGDIELVRQFKWFPDVRY